MAFNLGRARTDLAGAQDTLLNGIKQLKTALPRFTGKNADSLNSLAQFIEDKLSASGEFNKKLTSKNTDATLERIHSTLVKLKEALDENNEEAFEELKSGLLTEVKSIITDTGNEKPKEVLLSEEDKEYIKDLITASTLTEATEKTKDQSGQNGLTKDDIDQALNRTIEEQKSLNTDVVSAAEEANSKVEKSKEPPDDIKNELQEMFKDDESGSKDIEELKAGNASQFDKIQQMLSSQIGILNNHIEILGDNFKETDIFNFKNPFSGAVGKVPSVVDRIGEMLGDLHDSIQYGITSTTENISQAVSDQMAEAEEKKNMTLTDKIKGGIFKMLIVVGKGILSSFKFIGMIIFKAISGVFKLISSKLFKRKKKQKTEDKKPSKIAGLLNSFKKPKPVQLTFGTIKTIATMTASMVNTKNKKKKKKGLLSKFIKLPTVPDLSSKDKKEKKAKGGFLKKIGSFFKNIGKFIGEIVKSLIKGLCESMVMIAQAIAKCIGIILRPFFIFLWASPLGITMILIALGIFLISLAVKKLVNFIVDDLGPIIKEKLKMIDPKTLNRFINSASKFIDTFSSILAGAFAPILMIGTILKNLIEPIGIVVKSIGMTLAKVLVPVIEFIGEMIKIILVPIMQILKVLIIGIMKILSALIKPIMFLVDLIVKIVEKIVVPIFNILFKILMPIIEMIGMIINIIWKIVEPLWNIIKGVIMGILTAIGKILDEMKPIIDIIVDVVVNGIMFILNIVLIPIKVVIWAIKKIIDGIKLAWDKLANWWKSKKQALANWEIGAWKFKFRPFAFLGGKKGTDDTKEAPDGASEESKKIIDELNEKIKGLQTKIDISQNVIKGLQKKLKEAQSVTVSKAQILIMIITTKKMAKDLQNLIIPGLTTILNAMRSIIKCIKDVKDYLKQIKKQKGSIDSKVGIFDKLKSKMAENVKEASNIANKVSSKIPSPIKTIAKFTPLGGLFSLAKKDLDFAASKVQKPKAEDIAKPEVLDAIKQQMNGGKDTKLNVTQQSVQEQFKPIQQINAVNAENMKNITNDFEDIKSEATTESNKNKDITNNDLKTFLMTMFTNVDKNFESISEKLDNPQMLPMPTPMNIENQALIGAYSI